MIYFYLPDFYYFYNFNIKLQNLLEQFPNYFLYNDIKIGAIYGCFPNQIWNGGRCVVDKEVGINNITSTIEEINKHNIPIRFTYTNCLLEEKHLEDLFCNIVTDIAYKNNINEILVYSELLENYLRKKYPNFKYILSTTRCLRDTNIINDLLDKNKYDLIVNDSRDNFDFEFLKKIKQKDKIELLLDPHCKRNCPLRENHYISISKSQLGIDTEDFKCPDERIPWYELEKSDHIIKSEDVQKYIDMGFRHFKLEGRSASCIDVIDSYVYYLIKPEFQNEIRNILLKNIFI